MGIMAILAGLATGIMLGIFGSGGSVAGTRVAGRLSAAALKRGFGVFLVLVASYILINTLLQHSG